MEPNGRDDARDRQLRLAPGSDMTSHGPDAGDEERPAADVVFDFTGLRSPHLTDLALILTARLSAAPGGRVWARALPLTTWQVLRALGLDHLFRLYPGPSDEPN